MGRLRLTKRADGRYRCVYKGKYFYGATQQEALKKRDDYKAAVKRGMNPSNITVEIFAGNSRENLQNELDCCWCDYAGQDICETLERYKGGVPVVHLKDYKLEGHLSSAPYALIGISTDNSMKDEGGSFEYRPLGCGQVDMEKVILKSMEVGAQWLCVEQDNPTSIAKDAFEGPARSAEYLKKAGLL